MPKKTVKKTTKKTTKKTAPKTEVVPQAVPVAPPAPPVKTEAEKIWDEIKFLPIQMFGLPSQVVANHCTFYPVEPSKLFVTIRSSATLPSLEAAIAPKFLVELVDKWVMITRAPQLPGKR